MNEAELLFSEILKCSRTDLYLERKRKLDNHISRSVAEVLQRRFSGEPIEYILGKTEFMGLEFKVNHDVLIPRPETEILIETALRYAAGRPNLNILDLGSGCGCIAVSLAKFLPQSRILATDISASAIQVAKENAALNAVAERIEFIRCDLFAALGKNVFDMIVSNPPYVRRQEIKRLAAEIQHEPLSALDGGIDGLDFYRRIIQEAPEFLKPEGLLILEMGFDQCEPIQEIFFSCAKLKVKEVIKDYNNINRVVAAERKKYG